MIVKPFRGWRPPREAAALVASPPYDIVDTAEAQRLAAGNPDSFLHVVRPEIDLPDETASDDPSVYRQGRIALRGLIERGRLVRDPRPSFYVYRMIREGRDQTGVVGLAAVGDYLSGKVRKHEHTRPDKETDRVRHIEALGAQAGPVLLAYRDDPEPDRAARRATANSPEADFDDPDGVRHTLWVVDDPGEVRAIEDAFAAVPATYVADGHHRAAAAARAAACSAHEASGGFLAIHFPATQLTILDYNRVVRDLGGRSEEEFIRDLGGAGVGIESPHEAPRPAERGTFGMYLGGGRWSLLRVDPRTIDRAHPVRSLDVAVLSDRVLEPLLGIRDLRTDPRVDSVGGVRGLEELERRVDSGQYRVAFALRPTDMSDVLRVADAGMVMPPKSTWFEPKARSGLVVHAFDSDPAR